MMSTTQKVQRLRGLLRNLSQMDFGYPIGEQVVRPPQSAEVVRSALSSAGLAGASSLADFYAACDGMSLPDVHVGYFIKPVMRLVAFDPASEPHTVKLQGDSAVVPIGSTGGGSLFVMDRQTGGILLLKPGSLHDGVYHGTPSSVVMVASDMGNLFDIVIADVDAFVGDDRQHHYIAAQ
jgi:hypothetical protein